MDDEEIVRKIVGRMLARLGWSCETVADGDEAVRRFKAAREAGTPFDAVLVDLSVPKGMGGEEAAREILALEPGARIILSSGYAADPILANYATHGFCGVVVKPYTQQCLKEALGLAQK